MPTSTPPHPDSDPGRIPPAPTLTSIDGGPAYYGQFANPLPSSPSYFPIGVWGA